MKNTFFIPVILSALFFGASCKDDGKGNPYDNMNNRDRDRKDDRYKPKDDNKDDYPNNRDEGMDRDYTDERTYDLAGTWEIMDVQTNEDLSPEELSAIKASSIEFVGDGTYMTKIRADGRTETEYGTYTFDRRSGKLVTINDKDNEREVMEVEFKGRDKIEIFSRDKDLKLIMERF